MEKHLYKLWVALIAISSAVAILFVSIAAKETWKYFSLNSSTSAEILEWNVTEVSSSRYALEANYRYQVGSVFHTCKRSLDSPRFLNRYAAENQIKSWQRKSWRVWYNERDPSHSFLERNFPRKQLFHALLTFGVAAYFYFSRHLLNVNFARRELNKAK